MFSFSSHKVLECSTDFFARSFGFFHFYPPKLFTLAKIEQKSETAKCFAEFFYPIFILQMLKYV